MRTDLCSCLGHSQNGCKALADIPLGFVPHEEWHGALSILKQVEILSPDGPEMRAVKVCQKAHRQWPECCKACADGGDAGAWS